MIVPFKSLAKIHSLATALPKFQQERAEKLLTFLAYAKPPGLAPERYSRPLETLLGGSQNERNRILNGPFFGVWLERFFKWLQENRSLNQEKNKAKSIPPPTLDLVFLSSITRKRMLREEDIPPFLREVIPPSFEFSTPAWAGVKSRPPKAPGAYEGAVKTALSSLDMKWPGLKPLVDKFISHFLILEKAEFRSCSADRYLGLVLLSTSDQSLIEIEESIVHELGHQILYRLDRARPVFRNREDDLSLKLPWSGSRRNYYGFFHAVYIYLFLRDFFRIAEKVDLFDRGTCKRRLNEIQTGLEMAIPTISNGKDLLTNFGNQVSEQMVAAIASPKIVRAHAAA